MSETVCGQDLNLTVDLRDGYVAPWMSGDDPDIEAQGIGIVEIPIRDRPEQSDDGHHTWVVMTRAS
jgi:hypothetical protein